MKKFSGGLAFLSSKVAAVIAATIGSLMHVKSDAQIQPSQPPANDSTISYEDYQKKILKRQLVLKLNLDNPDNSLLAFHRSHSSHSSHSSHYSSSSSGHSSHSSHSSHASHYSGSTDPSGSYTPSYTPTYSSPRTTTPHTTTPHTTTPQHTPSTNGGTGVSGVYSGTTTGTADIYLLGSRILYKGCRGSDVKELQRLLFALNYRLLITGYFGDQTETAVIKFQKENELQPNGKVDSETLGAIQSKKNGK